MQYKTSKYTFVFDGDCLAGDITVNVMEGQPNVMCGVQGHVIAILHKRYCCALWRHRK